MMITQSYAQHSTAQPNDTQIFAHQTSDETRKRNQKKKKIELKTTKISMKSPGSGFSSGSANSAKQNP